MIDGRRHVYDYDMPHISSELVDSISKDDEVKAVVRECFKDVDG